MPIRRICLHVHRPVAIDPLLQRLTGDERHDQVGQAVPRIHRVDRHDVIVHDRGGGARLAGKPAPSRGARGKLGSKHLDRHGPAQCGIERLEHHAESAAAQQFRDFIRPQPAQRPRIVRAGEKVERLISAPARFEPAGRTEMRGSGDDALETGRAAEPRCQLPQLAPEPASGGQPLEARADSPRTFPGDRSARPARAPGGRRPGTTSVALASHWNVRATIGSAPRFKGFSGFVDLLDLATDPGNDSALVLIDRPQRHPQRLGHDLG